MSLCTLIPTQTLSVLLSLKFTTPKECTTREQIHKKCLLTRLLQRLQTAPFFPQRAASLVPLGARWGVTVIRAPEGLTSSNSDLLDLVSQRKPQSACQSGSPHDLSTQAWSQWAAQSSPTASWVTHSLSQWQGRISLWSLCTKKGHLRQTM